MESCVGTPTLLLPASIKSQSQAYKNHTRPMVVGMQPLPYKIGKGELQSTTSRHSSPLIRCAAVNAKCSAGQTQTVAREARTINVTPGKAKTPKLDDNGPGLPPHDNDGNGGNGGGGGNWSGGLALLGILGVLDILKEIETEWLRKNERRFSRD